MISSITVKNLLASDDEDNDANYQDINEEKFFNYSDEFTSTTKRTKMENGYKQEISLPKTRLTQRGQLYLYTDGTEDERDYALNKNLINKAYSKKWIDDISDDFGLDPASIFDQDTPKSMETGNCILNKLGKQTDYFIHELKLKSVKERFMGKANYFEYLPDDYDPRIELVETLKALNINRQTPPNNKTSDTPTDRRRPSNNYSRFSFANDIPECNSSDDEKDYSNEMNNKPESRLSNQPVLSAQSLINKLSCKVLNEESVENGKNEEPPRVSELTINYKDVFNLEDVHTCSSRLESERKSSLTKADTAITAAALAGVAPSLDSITSPKPAKILFKRADLNASPTCAERSSHNHHSSATPRRTSRVHSSPSFFAAKQTMNKVALSNRNNSPRDAATTPSRIGLLKVTGSSSRPHAEAELPNLGSMRQANSTPNYPHRHAHHHHNNNFNAPMRPFQSTNEPDTAEDTHLAPITISVTEIEHEPTGNSVRIRKFFDRKALRIKQMNINFKDVDPTRQKSKENRFMSNKHHGELVNLNNANNNNPPVDVLSARLNSNDTESSSTRRNINSAPVSQPPLIDEQEINSARPRLETQTPHGIIYSSRIQTPEVQEPQSPKSEPEINENIQPVNEIDDVKSTPHQEAEEFVSIPRVASLNEILECSNIENNSPQSGNSARVIITPVSSPRSNEKPQRRASTRQSSRLSSMEAGTKTPRRSSTTTLRKPSTDANDHQTLASNSHEQMKYSATQSRKESATDLNFNPATSQPHSRRSTPGAKSPQHTVEHTTAELVEPLLRSEIVDSSQVATPADPVDNNPPVVDSSRRSSFSLSRESFNFDPDEIVDKNETDDETLIANDDVDKNSPQTTQQVDHIIPTMQQFNLDEQLIVTPRHTTSLVSVDQPEQDKKNNDSIKSPDVPQDNRLIEDEIINLKNNLHTTPVEQERNVLQHVVSVDVPPNTSELDESKRINVEEVGQEKGSETTSGHSSSEIIRVKKVDFASEEQKDDQHTHSHSNELVHSHTDLEEATVKSTQSVDEEPKHRKIILKKDDNTPGAGASSLKTNHLKSKKNASSNRRKTSLVRHKPDTVADLKHKSQLKSDSRVSSDTLDSLSKTDIAIDHMNTLVESKDTMKMEEPPPQKTIPEVTKKERNCRYPYLTIPWYSKEPIVNYEAYYKRFDLPESLCPELLNLDPKDVSVDELIYERRVLEDKILELKQIKLANKDVKTTKDRKFTKKQTTKKPSKQEQKRLKDISSKERVIFEERLRLHEEAKKNKLERDRMLNVFVDKLKEKYNEIDDLNTQLESNTQDFESHNKNIANQLTYLDNTEDEIHDAIGKSRQELHATIEKRQAETRRQQKEMQEERREEKMFEFDVKKKEISWLLDLYTDEEELRKVNSRLIDLELKRTEWLKNFENKVIDEEKELDRREEIEWDKLHQVELEEEETALKDLKREQLELLEEKKKLVDNFENMKQKIHDRIESIKEEIKVIENEKVKFEQDLQANIQKQKETLDEILNAEREARESIKNDLEKYRLDLITTREKNIKMRSHLSFLTHMHAINKPYLFSYGVHWPLESFARPFNEDKRKQGNNKKKPDDLDEI